MSKSSKWFIAILAFLALLVIGFIFFVLALVNVSPDRTETVTTGSGEEIAVVDLKGVITSSDDVVRQLKKYRRSHSIKAILLHVDSPGGGVVASQEMYQEVKKTRDGGTPVIVSMGSLAASGGYYVSCAGTRLVANPGTLTGSIGVISEFLQLHDALGKLGVDVKTIKSGKMKDAGSPTKNMTAEEEKVFQDLMDDVHTQFITVVEKERGLSHQKVVTLADGRVFTGEQAVGLGLVDTLGTFEDAIRIAADIAGIRGEPALVREKKREFWWETIFGSVGETIRGMKQDLLDRPVLSYRFDGPL